MIIGKNEKSLLDKKVLLTGEDAEVLVEHENVIKKFLLKTKFNYQLELCMGTYKGREETIYVAMETIDNVIESLKNIEKGFKQYIKEQEEKSGNKK